MKKAIYKKRSPIPSDVIEVVEFEKPVLKKGQVLIEVLASPVNPSDLLSITGQYGMLPPLPATAGYEGLGRVVEHGPDVLAPAIGQSVLLPIGNGAWTTHLVAQADNLICVSNNIDPLQLAMITINPPTAFLLLNEIVKLEPGDWVIQNAANSAVGSYLVQLAKNSGYKTVNIVRRESAVSGVQENGGDVTLVDGENLPKKVEEITRGAEIKLGLDAIGGSATNRMMLCLSQNATLVSYGALSGDPCELSPRDLIFKDITFKGFWLAKWLQETSQQRQMDVFGELLQMITSGKLHTSIDSTYKIEDIKQAVTAADRGGRKGKILITP
ncbi:MAG: zinc-dependent alcohol dehydrogenase family protein [Desulfobacteraceae bacterium]|nr:zinc-dependent alcohol dehydrogenase family protein [Desulfobacteraceae bacterium]